MEQERKEEHRYCPTCQKKTTHWVTRTKALPPSVEKPEKEGAVTKIECRVCGTVENF